MYFYFPDTHHIFTIKIYYSPTNAQVDVLKTILKFYIKIAATCFGALTPSSGISLSVLVKVTLC